MAGIRVFGVAVLAVGLLAGAGNAQAAPAACAAGNPLQPTAELFATDNTATITDPDDPRLRTRLEGFELAVDGIAVRNIVLPVGSTLVSGVFWSDEQQQATYERSRAFHLACVAGPDLATLAEQVRSQFHQESVLTFEHLAQGAPGIDAVTVQVPGIDVRRFRDGLVANPDARERLVGGSVTESGTLILVVDLTDLPLAQQFVTEIGGTWSTAEISTGDREFVG